MLPLLSKQMHLYLSLYFLIRVVEEILFFCAVEIIKSRGYFEQLVHKLNGAFSTG